MRLAIRTSGNLDAIAAGLPAIARSIDRNIAVSSIVPFRDVVDRTIVLERLVAHVATAFGLLALAIAAVGVYGVLAYAVVQRRREIGLRIAVGARPGAVGWLFLRESLVSVGLGVVVGLPAAFAVTRLASSMLYGLEPSDPASVAGAVGVLGIAAGTAAYTPARRAAGIDPIEALRGD